MLKFGIISFHLNCSYVDLDLALCHNLVFKLYTKLLALCCCMQCSDRLAFLLPDQCGLNQVQVNRSRCSIYWALTSVQKSWEINSSMLIIQTVWKSNVVFFSLSFSYFRHPKSTLKYSCLCVQIGEIGASYHRRSKNRISGNV